MKIKSSGGDLDAERCQELVQSSENSELTKLSTIMQMQL